MGNKLRKGMEVLVIAGREKGKMGKVLRIDREANRIVVEGINMIKKATRPTQQNQGGGFVEREAPLSVSSVSAIDPSTKKQVRVGFRMEGNTKVRIGRSKTNSSGQPLAIQEKA